MKILHICWGLEKTNGAANIARLILGEQQAAGHAVEFVSKPTWRQLRTADQIWCHCGWYWMFWLVALYKRLFHSQPATCNLNLHPPTSPLNQQPQPATSTSNPFLYRMTECCYDPIRLRYHGWKKRLVGPVERWSLRQCDALVATCEAEAQWNRDYIGKACPQVEVNDIKRFFKLNAEELNTWKLNAGNAEELNAKEQRSREGNRLNILYLGRPHPLKGTKYLEQAVKELNEEEARVAVDAGAHPSPSIAYNLRLVSDHTGEELERDWAWCDVLCLPTLSDNFGLVIAEALSRGKRVVTTDGAPAWADCNNDRLVYLAGFVANENRRVSLLKDALAKL